MCSSCDGCLLDSTEQLCTKLASDLTYAVVQATGLYSQVKNSVLGIVLVIFSCTIFISLSFLFCPILANLSSTSDLVW